MIDLLVQLEEVLTAGLTAQKLGGKDELVDDPWLMEYERIHVVGYHEGEAPPNFCKIPDSDEIMDFKGARLVLLQCILQCGWV